MEGATELSPRTLFRVGFFFELALVLVAAVIGSIVRGAAFPFRLDFEPRDMLLALGATAPPAAAALLLTSRAGTRIPFLGRIYERVKELFDHAIRGLGLDEILILAAAAGIGEEVLFRGVLQPSMGLVATSLTFGLLHALTPAYFILATLMGAYLGWLQEATGNLLVPIIVHWLYDALAFWLLRRRFAADAREAAEREGPRREPGPPELLQ
jgi:membrane protease YdiL (CAAX protease family)